MFPQFAQLDPTWFLWWMSMTFITKLMFWANLYTSSMISWKSNTGFWSHSSDFVMNVNDIHHKIWPFTQFFFRCFCDENAFFLDIPWFILIFDFNQYCESWYSHNLANFIGPGFLWWMSLTFITKCMFLANLYTSSMISGNITQDFDLKAQILWWMSMTFIDMHHKIWPFTHFVFHCFCDENACFFFGIPCNPQHYSWQNCQSFNLTALMHPVLIFSDC